MNAKFVLSRIAKILTLSDNTPIQAKTEDGKIFQSSNFDVNDDVMEVGADGKLTPAEDGEYTITFTTPEGKESTQVIDIDGGKIAGIETAEEAEQEAAGTEEEVEEMDDMATEMTDAGTSIDPTKGATQNRIDINSVPNSKVTVNKENDIKFSDEKKGALTTDKAKSLPNTTNEDPANRVKEEEEDGSNDPVISLSARMDALESKLNDMYSRFDTAFPSEGQSVSSLTPNPSMMMNKEEELPKLNGAPIEPIAKFASQNRNNFGKKSDDYQSNFLNKLYK
jgi:hypothetical protein